MHTHDILTIAAAIVPDRDALVHDGLTLTYAGLADRANRLANALAALGVGPGDRVTVMDVNTPVHFEAYFAAARLDAVYVPLNFRGHGEEVGYPLRHASPKVVIAGERYAPLIAGLTAAAASASVLAVDGGEPPDGWRSYEDLVGEGDADEMLFPEGSPDETAVLLYTAGTTGQPKAVMLSHDSFTSFMLANMEPPDPDVEERTLLTLPLYHIAGLAGRARGGVRWTHRCPAAPVRAARVDGARPGAPRRARAHRADDAQAAAGPPGVPGPRPLQPARADLRRGVDAAAGDRAGGRG